MSDAMRSLPSVTNRGGSRSDVGRWSVEPLGWSSTPRWRDPLRITPRHPLQGDRPDPARLTGGAEGFEARHAEAARGGDARPEVLARIEVGRFLGQPSTDGARHGKPDVGVDVDLAHPIADALLDLFD